VAGQIQQPKPRTDLHRWRECCFPVAGLILQSVPLWPERLHFPAPRRRKALCLLALLAVVLPALPSSATAQKTELTFADFNSQTPFNQFSGDCGTFAASPASLTTAFDTSIFHGANGAALRLDYSVSSGFCGVWFSLLGRLSFPQFNLNFTNLYGALRNSAGNPSRIEHVHVRQFSFWARGDGPGDFDHTLKIEFKNRQGVVGAKLFSIPNRADWARYEFPLDELGNADVSQMKEVTFVIEATRNDRRTARLFLDDLSFNTDELPYHAANWKDDAFLDVVSQRAFYYFLTFTDGLGFALDRSTFSDEVSAGAIGFQLAAYCVGHQHGWADRADLENRVATVLRNLAHLPMGPETGTLRAGQRGFFYHFLTANTGLRKDNQVELSPYDTMLLLFGVLTAREYFPANAEIQTLSGQLFDRVEWDWMVDHAPGINSNRFHLAWTPGPEPAGTFAGHVDGQTDEALMLDVLALGSKTHPVSRATYLARNRLAGAYPPENPDAVLPSWKGSLFTYFFASCWVDLHERGFDLHPTRPVNIWENNRQAVVADHEFCRTHGSTAPDGADGHFHTYGENAWGLSACDNLVEPTPGLFTEYFAFGALPSEENLRFGTRPLHAGTLPVYGAASAINFLPDAALAALRHDFEIPGLWSPLFGLGDAFSLDPHFVGHAYDANGNPQIRAADFLNGPWVNRTLMGVNLGPMLLALENYRSGLIWKLAARNPEITAGLDKIFGIQPPEDAPVTIEQNRRANSVNLSWEPVPGASSYCVYASVDLKNWILRQSGITATAWTDPNAGPESRFYCLKALP